MSIKFDRCVASVVLQKLRVNKHLARLIDAPKPPSDASFRPAFRLDATWF